MKPNKKTQEYGIIKQNGSFIAPVLTMVVVLYFNLFFAEAFSQRKTDPVAENILIYQRYNGGWAKAFNNKKITYEQVITKGEQAQIINRRSRKDATIDNHATSREIDYLLNAYHETDNAAYLKSAEKGLSYLLKAQYGNGGWPQYYPDSSLYRSQITFNDNAIINVMKVLYKVANRQGNYAAVKAKYVPLCTEAVKRGIDCILKTQIVVDGKKTAWNQQYNKSTLLPEKARSFELVGLATSESVAIIEFLMKLPHPSTAVKEAINAAMSWFEKVAIKGYSLSHFDAPDQPIGKDAKLVKDDHATIWARFYEIGTNRPFFSGRNSVKKYRLSEIENERRVGYAWYGSWPAQLIHKTYPAWLKINGN